jgi:hypothetical protein
MHLNSQLPIGFRDVSSRSFNAFTDAAYADDKETRRNSEGYVFRLLGGALV